MSKQAPPLPGHCNSWIIYGTTSLQETFNKRVADRAAGTGLQVVPTSTHLNNLNKYIREHGTDAGFLLNK